RIGADRSSRKTTSWRAYSGGRAASSAGGRTRAKTRPAAAATPHTRIAAARVGVDRRDNGAKRGATGDRRRIARAYATPIAQNATSTGTASDQLIKSGRSSLIRRAWPVARRLWVVGAAAASAGSAGSSAACAARRRG